MKEADGMSRDSFAKQKRLTDREEPEDSQTPR